MTIDSFSPTRLPDVEFSCSGPLVSGDRSFEILYQSRLVGTRLWVFPADLSIPDAADFIYARDMDTKISHGFARRTLIFETADGPLSLQGPWKSNSDQLFRETGVDLRESHLTIGVVARYAKPIDLCRAVYSGVLFADEAPVNGHFDRIEMIAQRYADELGQRIFFSMRSHGSGHAGSKSPRSQKDPSDAQ